MKHLLLLSAVVGLSSCVAKTWMVGSVNDQLPPPRLHNPKVHTTVPQVGSGQLGAGINASAKNPSINPVGHTSSNPTR